MSDDIVRRFEGILLGTPSEYRAPIRLAIREIASLQRQLADLKAQHLLTQAEEMHRTLASAQKRRTKGGYPSGTKPASQLEPPPSSKGLGAANEPPTTPGVPLRPDPGVPHTRGGTPL